MRPKRTAGEDTSSEDRSASSHCDNMNMYAGHVLCSIFQTIPSVFSFLFFFFLSGMLPDSYKHSTDNQDIYGDAVQETQG